MQVQFVPVTPTQDAPGFLTSFSPKVSGALLCSVLPYIALNKELKKRNSGKIAWLCKHEQAIETLEQQLREQRGEGKVRREGT